MSKLTDARIGAVAIKNETSKNANTAQRVGGVLTDIVEAIEDNNIHIEYLVPSVSEKGTEYVCLNDGRKYTFIDSETPVEF